MENLCQLQTRDGSDTPWTWLADAFADEKQITEEFAC
jgi:hypothetical protein